MNALCPAALAALLALGACRTDQTFVVPDPHLERMLDQPKAMPYADDPDLPSGMTMQKPPEGTLRADLPELDTTTRTGTIGEKDAPFIPIHLDRALVLQGQARFDTFCAPCHGVAGDSDSVVGDRMSLRRPPDLHEARIVAFAPGRLFRTIREGYGLMPSYAVQLSPLETWTVVAYVRALQTSQHVSVARLTPALRGELARQAAP